MNIQTFGKLSVTENGSSFDNEKMRSPLMAKLFVFLLIHRDKALSKEEISATIWDDSEIDNPFGALKNLTYRLRNFLSKNLGEKEWILSAHGSYRWNPDIDIRVDFELFDELADSGLNYLNEDSYREKFLKDAIDIYTGDFVPFLADTSWAANRATAYRMKYLECVRSLSDIYIKKEDYETLEFLTRNALLVVSANDDIYAKLITSYVNRGMYKQAKDVYDSARKALYKEFGTDESEILDRVCDKLYQSDYTEKIEDLRLATEEMKEDDPNGAFLCDYPAFRSIYQLEARRTTRLNESEYMLLLTLEPTPIKKDNVPTFSRPGTESAKHLKDAIINSLRTGDIATRCAESQFMVLLPGCNFENACLVAERMLGVYRDLEPNDKIARVNVMLEDISSCGQNPVNPDPISMRHSGRSRTREAV